MAKIAFCQNIPIEFMGVMLISALLKKEGHTVEVFIDFNLDENKYIDEICNFRPDILAFSVLTPTFPWALGIAKKVKSNIETISVFGGVHAIVEPEIIKESAIDIVCIGEGQLPMKQLASCIDKGMQYNNIPAFWVKIDGRVIRNQLPQELVNLDELPFQDRKLYDKYSYFRRSKQIRVLLGQGCPYKCSYCTNKFLANHFGAKKYIRKRDPQNIITELKQLVKERKPSYVYFPDEVLWLEKRWLKEFLKLYKKYINLPFTASLNLGVNIKEDDIRELAEAGADYLALATESGDEDQRKKMLNKNVKNEKYLKIAGWLHKYKINFGCNAFFGLPNDTIDDHIDRIDFFRKLKCTYLWTTFFQPYPGVDLTECQEVQSLLDPRSHFQMSFHHQMPLNVPNKLELENLKKTYHYLVTWPSLVTPFRWLIKFRVPFLFDLLFFFPFTWYAIKAEKISMYHYWQTVKLFVIYPKLRQLEKYIAALPLGHREV